MQAALRSRLLADATVSGLVGERVDWGLRPQAKSLPAISLTLIPTPRSYTMRSADATQHYMVQADCWASTPGVALALRQAVIAELEPPSGDFLGGFVLRDQDKPERIETGEIVQCASIDFKIFHVSA